MILIITCIILFCFLSTVKPRVTVEYEFTTSTIMCSADANPVTDIQYVIFLNDTAQTPGPSLPFNNADYGCTRVRCDVTNSVGTGTDTRSEELCPGMQTHLFIFI